MILVTDLHLQYFDPWAVDGLFLSRSSFIFIHFDILISNLQMLHNYMHYKYDIRC